MNRLPHFLAAVTAAAFILQPLKPGAEIPATAVPRGRRENLGSLSKSGRRWATSPYRHTSWTGHQGRTRTCARLLAKNRDAEKSEATSYRECMPIDEAVTRGNIAHNW